MVTSHNQCQDLKAKYEKASSETKTKHEEILQNLQKMLVDTEDKLKAAQEANRDLMQDMEELKTQADKAKVCSGAEIVHLCSILARFCIKTARELRGACDLCMHGRVAHCTCCGFQCFVTAALLVGEGHGHKFSSLNVLCSHHHPLCCLSPVVATSYCCLASLCLLAVDSLLGKHLSLILAKPPCTRVVKGDKYQKGRRQRPREASGQC